MKRLVIYGFAAVALIWLVTFVACTHAVTPNPGEEVVLTRKPILFGSGGVDPVPVKTGRRYVMWTTTATTVNMQPQQHQVHFEDLMSRDGVPLDFDSVIRLRINDSPKLVERFGVNWYKTNVEQPFMTAVRQSVRKHGMNETAINATAIDEIDNEVTGAMQTYVKTAGLPVDVLDVTVGRANPPDSVKTQRTETAAQEQRVNTEKQRLAAETERENAERKRASADNAYREGMQLSPLQFIELERIKMLRDACTPHTDRAGCTFLIGTDATPILQVK